MGDFSRHLGRGTRCAYCGEHELGVEAKAVTVVSFEDWYPDEGELVLDPDKPAELQIVEYLKKHGPDPTEVVQCPMCGETAEPEYGDITSGEMWQCVTCEDVYEDKDEADGCCEYTRKHEERHREYAARERARLIEEAKNLLAEEGFLLNPPQQAQPRLQPQEW